MSDTLSDLYVLGGFVCLLGKTLLFGESFIDHDIAQIAIPTAIIVFLAAVLFKIAYRINETTANIRLSRHFLTLVRSVDSLPPRLEDAEQHYINRSWPLFRRSFRRYYKNFCSSIQDNIELMENWLKPELKQDNPFTGWNPNNLRNQLEPNAVLFIPCFPQETTAEMLSELDQIIADYEIGLKLVNQWRKEGIDKEIVFQLLGSSPKWNGLSSKTENQIEDGIKKIPEIQNLEINEQWVKSIYERLDSLSEELKKWIEDLMKYQRSLKVLPP